MAGSSAHLLLHFRCIAMDLLPFLLQRVSSRHVGIPIKNSYLFEEQLELELGFSNPIHSTTKPISPP